jgi:hypothetical protein
MNRRLIDYEATKGQRKCQYCWKNLAHSMTKTRNGRRWKCDECINRARDKP